MWNSVKLFKTNSETEQIHAAWCSKHLKELLKSLQLSNEVSTSMFFSQGIYLPKSHMLHTSCQTAAGTSARRECSQLLIATIDKKTYVHSFCYRRCRPHRHLFVRYCLKGKWTCSLQILVSLHPECWIFFLIHYYKQELSIRGLFTDKYQKAVS